MSITLELQILRLVATYKEEIKDDDEYCDEFYPLVDQIYNIGRLTLIAKPFIDWAIFLTVLVNLFINEERIISERTKVMENCYVGLLGNITLFQKFENACKNIKGVTEELMRKCHSAIVRKTINARSGLVFELFHEKYLGHYSKKGVQTELQKELQILMKQSQ